MTGVGSLDAGPAVIVVVAVAYHCTARMSCNVDCKAYYTRDNLELNESVTLLIRFACGLIGDSATTHPRVHIRVFRPPFMVH